MLVKKLYLLSPAIYKVGNETLMAKLKTEETPLMQQHRAIKQKYPDAVLLFRVGDFYETFGQDAVIASQVLGITLTKRNNGAAASSDLAGFPHHALDTYLHKLVKAGYRVAICDQLEDPKLVPQGGGRIVKRGVTEMVTPGTTVNDKILEHASNNFLAGIHFADNDQYGLAFLDISTGEFFVAEGDREYADKLLQGFKPAEVIFQRHQQKKFKEYFGGKIYIYTLDEWIFDQTYAHDILLKHFQTYSLKDNTVSPMGARLLKRWLVFPLKDIQKINERLDLVEYFILQTELRNKITHSIKQCGDVERLVSKIPLKKINPRELLHLAKGLKQVNEIKQICSSANNEYLKRLGDTLNPSQYIADKIFKEIVENPPPLAIKGGMINSGINDKLDELRNIAYRGKNYLAQLQQKEAEATGISSLRIGFNNVFGYYLEVTNSHKNKVPSAWMRKQTLANAERYITPELKEYEEKITGAEEKILQIEWEVYESLLNELLDYLSPIQTNGNILAILDCIACFAYNAIQYQYKKPQLHTGNELVIKEGRHPVIERNLPVGESYIANDIELNKDEQQIIILTGPNMSGKSALLRQTALITLMAHAGSFVPASEAKISLTDKIFTRVGASDNLSGGESTFMVEMNETASIINNITPASLILLDEIGRGTSTYDGISIAWCIAEYLHSSPHQPKTLFATHYHELNELEEKFSRVKNYHITNKEAGNKIIFLRKLARGGSTHSFGIHVAKMAGMPTALIERANDILKQLENKHVDEEGQKNQKTRLENKIKNLSLPQIQLSIFDTHTETFKEIRELLDGIDINRLTPVEALLKLQEIKNLLR